MKTTNRKIKIIVEKTDSGFSAFAESEPVYTTGRTIPELIDNSLEATALCFEDEEFKITKEELTNSVSLVITDFAEEDELVDNKNLWDQQVNQLQRALGV